MKKSLVPFIEFWLLVIIWLLVTIVQVYYGYISIFLAPIVIIFFFVLLNPLHKKFSELLKTKEFWITLVYIFPFFPFVIFVVIDLASSFLFKNTSYYIDLSWVYGYFNAVVDPLIFISTIFPLISTIFLFIGTILIDIGLILMIFVWKYTYFSKDRLVNIRLYGKIRHPQHLNFFIVLIGSLIQWPSIIRLVMFPFLLYMYYKLAKNEEIKMIRKFGWYQKYLISTNMFLPQKITNVYLIQKIRKNPFLLLSILLFCSFIISGYSLITKNYEGESIEDINIIASDSGIPVSLKISCISNKEFPISGGTFYCFIIPLEEIYYIAKENFLEDHSYSLNYSTGFLKSYYYGDQESIKKKSLPNDMGFAIPIEEPGNNFIQFEINFTDKKTGEVIRTNSFQEYSSISQEEYNKKKYEKIALLIGLISLSLVVSISTIRHLMEIWDRI